MVYIFSPYNTVSGGPELSQQLCRQIRSLGVDCKMVYYCTGWLWLPPAEKVAARYSSYENEYTCKPVDNEANVVIAPEATDYILLRFKRAKKILWWMSVDNYYASQQSLHQKIATFGNRYSLNLKRTDVLHLYQSEYARLHLKQLGIPQTQQLRLSDYLSEEYICSVHSESTQKKENNVLYNPKKGLEFTKQLIAYAPDIKFVALEGMTPAQLKDIMVGSKLYIDFGNHPGKDRMPREAAICGCCVITGRAGAANNPVDIPIPDAYKMDEAKQSVADIVAQIRMVLANYEKCRMDFDRYREIIKAEREEFGEDVKKLVSLFPA